MADQQLKMGSIRLGLAVAWPSFWTGVPFKIVAVLLLLAAGLHPWESTGLAFLVALSIPIDIWALGLCAKTVFLERLRVLPGEGLGVAIWWRATIFNALYLPAAYWIESTVVSGAKAGAAKIFEIEILHGIPIAERIAVELTMWGSVATVVLIILLLIWLFVFGRIVRGQANLASASTASYRALIQEWDLMRVPGDQGLLLTAFSASVVALVLLFWAFIPATTPHPHESYKQEVKKVPSFKPTEALKKSEQLLAQAEMAVQVLEEKAQEEAQKGKAKEKGAAKKDSVGAKASPVVGVKP